MSKFAATAKAVRQIAHLHLFVGVTCWASVSAGNQTQFTFQNDVMPVLSKAGCNLGSCHGNQNGKGGFRLSLRGEDPARDYSSMVHDLAGRRIDRIRPNESLLLRKPTARIPHQGGRRFATGSDAYEILRQWIAAGAAPPRADVPRLISLSVEPAEAIVVAPRSSLQLRVSAMFSDGTRRDVTQWAVFETTNLLASVDATGLVERVAFGETAVLVRYLQQQVPVRIAFLRKDPNFQWTSPDENNYVDRLIHDRLRALRANPAPVASDSVLARRAFLDVLGLLPTADEARRFVESERPDKLTRLIDSLLARPEFADHWSLKWSDLLRNEEKSLDPRGVDEFYQWIRDCFSNGTPLNEFVRMLVVGRGSTYRNPPANFYRSLRDPYTRAEAAARLFLGRRVQCAKCHNHPFDRWTQDDYYSWAAVFARIDYDILRNNRRDRLDKNEFNGEQIVLVKSSGEVRNPSTGKIALPRFLGESRSAFLPDDDRLQRLADWLTDPENSEFSRAQANRVFAHVFGRALVDPVDDFRVTNPALVPGLIEALADDLVRHDFDVRWLVRRLMNSRAYQLSFMDESSSNASEQGQLARAVVRRLTAECILDAQCQVLDVPPRFNGYSLGLRAGQLPGVRRVRLRDERPATGDRFLVAFGKPQRLMSCECERSDETTLTQALLLISGEGMHQRLSSPHNRLAELARSELTNAAIVEQLYWAALSRPPNDQEIAAHERVLATAEDRLVGLQDITWALLNSKEFLFRH